MKILNHNDSNSSQGHSQQFDTKLGAKKGPETVVLNAYYSF